MVYILYILIIFILSTYIIHKGLILVEKRKYPAPGQLVDINGQNMHIYSEGNGDRTIVLLSGWGTAAPVLDFTSLIKVFSKTYKIVVVENFGYGWSDFTNKERSIENIVKETRNCLKKAGHEPPYILMPHSISGIYSLYFAKKYPEEIEAIIGLDIGIPKGFLINKGSNQNKSLKTLFIVSKIVQRFYNLLVELGILRILSKCFHFLFVRIAAGGEYSSDTLKLIRLMYCRHFANKTLRNESNLFLENASKISDINFLKSLKILLLVSNEVNNLESKARIWYESHEDIAKCSDHSNFALLPGGHYLHWKCCKQIEEEVDQFLKYNL